MNILFFLFFIYSLWQQIKIIIFNNSSNSHWMNKSLLYSVVLGHLQQSSPSVTFVDQTNLFLKTNNSAVGFIYFWKGILTQSLISEHIIEMKLNIYLTFYSYLRFFLLEQKFVAELCLRLWCFISNIWLQLPHTCDK